MKALEFIFLKDAKERDTYHKVYINEIHYVVANGDYVSISTKERRYVVYGTITSWEERLPKDLFFRIHRSHIVQANLINTIEGNSVSINKTILPIGDSYKKQFFSQFTFL